MSTQDPACPLGIDDTFGPWAGPACRGGFDFTLLFEETILSVPLLAVFLLVLPVRVVQLARTDRKVRQSLQMPLKLCACAVLFGLNAALVSLWARSSPTRTPRTRATLPTTAMSLIASLGLMLLSWVEHDRSVRPSFVISTFLFLSVLLDLPRTRTLFMIAPHHRAIAAIFTTSLVLRVVIFVQESWSKRRILLPEHAVHPKEVTSSTASRVTFFWLTSLFLKGYKRILSLSDLDDLEAKMGSERLNDAISAGWEKVADKSVPGSLFKSWHAVFKWPMLAPVIPKLCLIGFTYSQPFLISAAIQLAVMPSGQPYDNVGYGLIGAYALVYIGIAISMGQYERYVSRCATMMRGSVSALIYRKALRLDLTSPSVSPSGALTLMGTDCETIATGARQLHELWASLLEIAVGMYLLYRELGAACAMPLSVTVVVLVTIGFLAASIGKSQAAWIQASQERVTATSKTLGSIKWLKISGLNDVAFQVIQQLRAKELEVSMRFRLLMGVSLVMLVAAPILTPILTFGTFAGLAARDDQTLTISRAFIAYSLLNLVSTPLANIIMALPILAGAVTSFQRIQDFLNGKEREDKRLSWRGAGGGRVPERKPGSMAGHNENDDDGDDDDGMVREGSVKVQPEPLADDVVASLSGSFRWKDDAEPVFEIGKWDIRRRAFTLLLGPVGCGKSTLLKALLGELSGFRGAIRTNFSGVAYCGQSPWLPNDTVRNAIVGGANFDEEWYRTVVRACALEPDLQAWPSGDGTVAGSMGISMSGGQKHRLAIARALYSRKEFLIFDNVFSGLDAATDDLVFDNIFGKQGLLRTGNTTVLMASSDSKRAPHADQVVVLDDEGHLQEDTVSREGLQNVLSHSRAMRKASVPEKEDDKTQAPRPPAEMFAQPIETIVATMGIQADSARRLGDSAMYLFYGKAAGWGTLISFMLAMVVFAFADVFPYIWLKWWSEANETGSNQDLGKWMGVYVALGIGAIASVLFGTWQLFIVVINNSGVFFHDMLLKTVSRAPMSFHSTVDTGVTINRFSQDLQLIDMELPATALGVAVSASIAVAQFVMIAVSTRYMAAILPFLALAFYVLQHFYLRTSRQMRLLDIEHKAPLYTQLIETLDGLETVRALRWAPRFESKNMRLLDESQRPSYTLYCLQRWLTFAVDMMVAGVAFVLIVLTTTLRAQIGPGYMGIALTNVLAFSNTIKGVVTAWVMLEVALGAVARVKSFVTETKAEGGGDAADGGHEEEKEASAEDGLEGWPSLGAVDIQGLTASYPSSGVVLNDVTLSIQPGQKVAICGRTGSGKSSLALSLLRMIDDVSGTITIDGIEVSTVPHEAVRSHLVAIPQETYVFSGTVRLNVDPSGLAASDGEIVRALEGVGLWDRIEARGGLDAVIDERFFSHGEAQLLVFARAMLRKGRVLILDEVTSSLDEDTSVVISEVLRTWFADWTVIAIAHKLDSIIDFDKVVVLDDGRVIELDNPRLLLQRDSVFKKMYELSVAGTGKQ